VADPVKVTARQALEALRREGLRIVMLTGDTRATAFPGQQAEAEFCQN